MFPFFNALLAPFVPLLGLYTLHRRFVQKKSAGSLAGQWGLITPAMRAFGRQSGPRFWLHAVSVGETMAARPIARALKARVPGARIALSSTTDSGHAIAQGLLAAGEVDLCFYFPLDLAPVQTRVLNALRPNALCLVETELWPNLLHLARRKNIPTFLVNGRVSDNLLRTAPRLGPLWKWMSGNVTGFLMRGADDAARLQKLGVPRSRIAVTGDVKLEAPPLASAPLRALWRARLGLAPDEALLIAGSTHAGEEEMVLRAAREIAGLRVALAPRHIERAGEVAAQIESAGWDVARRSQNEGLREGVVYLLDSVGELADFYAAAEVVFVGGSLIPRGGHNVLEAVLRGAPVLFGPHMMNFRAAAELVTQNDLGARVADEAELSQALRFWLDGAHRAGFAAQVAAALAPHQGAAARAAQIVAASLPGARPAADAAPN